MNIRAPELLLGTTSYSAAVDIWSIGCIFAEMATGLPLFPGRSDIDQLFKIYQRRGTPTEETWPGCTSLAYYNPNFPMWNSKPITDYVPIEDLGCDAAVDLLVRMLQNDPEKRINCKTALKHPFFNKKHD